MKWMDYFGGQHPTTNTIVTRGEKRIRRLMRQKILSKQKAIVMKSVVPTGAGDLFTAGFMYGLGSWKPLTLRNNAEKNNDQWTIEGIEDRNEMDGGFAGKCHCYDTWSKYTVPPHNTDIKEFLDEAKEPEYHPVFENGYSQLSSCY